MSYEEEQKKLLKQPGPLDSGNDINSDNHLSQNPEITSNIDRIIKIVIEQNMDLKDSDESDCDLPSSIEWVPPTCTYKYKALNLF